MSDALLKAGIEPDPVIEAYKKDVDRTLIRENLRRTVDERLQGLIAMRDWVAEAHRARERARQRPTEIALDK
jgi:hypothetical protein